MRARTHRLSLAAVFFVLGGWALLTPALALSLTVRPELQPHTRLVTVLMGTLGAQALLSGLFAAFSRFTRTTFLAYGLTLPLFLVFDYWFYMIEPLLTTVGMLDAFGNVLMVGLCVAGWRALRPGESA